MAAVAVRSALAEVLGLETDNLEKPLAARVTVCVGGHFPAAWTRRRPLGEEVRHAQAQGLGDILRRATGAAVQ